ncbi:hypothetical protein FA95DRAFT_652638 [Auriscalpium vulgare]|uniref:Uncharacterized protein n=1 Tax=Auriscalpium vulgare TaxID=40419 RepID=A0ACB8RDQ8_9AGAM|nr:hypothetical protein FA95DRAFT_652638 [Auriscalpium vulgare]
MWPSVRTLSVDVSYRPGESQSSIISAPQALQSLSIYRPNTWNILPRELPALRTLELRYLSRTDQHLLASGVLPQIRSLTVWGLPPSQDVLGQLAQLESLVFGELPVKFSLPKTLRHVGFYPHIRDRWPPVVEDFDVFLQALCALENLHLITCTRRSSAVLREALDRQCRDRRVDIVVYMNANCAPGVHNPDYV